MHQVLPLYLQDVRDEKFVAAIMKLSRMFVKILGKAVKLIDQEQVKEDCVEAICMLEKEMPPFFDVMSHFLHHLVQELYLCGPVQTRWMYLFERYYKY
jgi:hypothetical protein